MTQESASLEHLLARICRLHHRRAHGLLEDIGLHRGQPPLLRALWEEEGLTHSELAERLQVRPPTITRMLQRMERAGFLERRQDAEDQRVSRVYLTEAGRAIRENLRQAEHQLEEEAFAGFTAEEREDLGRFFLRMHDNLAKVSGDGPRRRGRRGEGRHRRHGRRRPAEAPATETESAPGEEAN